MKRMILFAACLTASVSMLAQASYRDVRTMIVADNETQTEYIVSDISEITFGKQRQYLVSVSGQVNGTVSGEGYYPLGTTVTLTATPAEGYRVAEWTIGTEAKKAAEIEITVKEENNISILFEEDGCYGLHAGKKYVDLGLASGKLWATYNVGASNPESIGTYYYWGSTKESEKLDPETKYNNTDNKTELEAVDDVASVVWGGSWHMPTQADWQELRDGANWQWSEDRKGYVITSKDPELADSELFLPITGYHYTIIFYEDEGFYWTSTRSESDIEKAMCVTFDDYEISVGDAYIRPYAEIVVRPVVDKASIEE